MLFIHNKTYFNAHPTLKRAPGFYGERTLKAPLFAVRIKARAISHFFITSADVYKHFFLYSRIARAFDGFFMSDGFEP